MKRKPTTIYTALLAISTTALLAFLALFIVRNAPGFHPLLPIILLGVVYGLIYTYYAAHFAKILLEPRLPNTDQQSTITLRLGLVVAAGLLLFVFIDSTVTDYYQPVSLYDDVIAALAITWGLSIIFFSCLALGAGSPSALVLRAALNLALVTLAGWPLAASLIWINSPAPGESVVLHRDVFVGGENGYQIYRIPGLVVLPQGSTLANGSTLKEDRILAFAEARLDGALDTGVIDLVMKTSLDGGATWAPQRIICHYERDGLRGKCGNPTPLFNAQLGTIHLAYNLSGIDSDDADGRPPERIHSSHIVSSDDGGVTWNMPVQVADDNLVFGPAHGLQKSHSPHRGRIIIPAYVNGHALVLYSDDNGESWHRSQGLNTGNETDVAELSNGSLYMTTRHNRPIGRPPSPNGRLFSISTDGGRTWPAAELDIALETPVCQAAVINYGSDGGLLFSNPSHIKSRVNLQLQYSKDNGASWDKSLLIYPGPAGYSALSSASNGDIFILYERGIMSYSERISLARVGGSAIR